MPILEPATVPGRSATSPVDAQEARRLGITGGYPRTLQRLAGMRGRTLNAHTVWPGADELVELSTLPAHGLLVENDLAEIPRYL